MAALNLMVYRHSAFYSPLLAGIGAGFFARAGFAPSYTVMPADRNVGAMLASGEIHVSQAAVSSAWPYLDRGETPPFAIFANLNRRDGFLIAARRPDPAFRWDKLASGRFMFAHGGQPQAMLAYALHLKGVDLGRISGIDAGGPDAAMAAFAAGNGDYFHEQAPYPQQLECEGHAHIVASVGEVIGPVAFSSLAATPAWLARPEAKTFLHAYSLARQWTHGAAPAEVAAAVQSFFPDIRPDALAGAIAYYQELGCWSGGLPLEPGEYETALNVFAHSGLVSRRHAFESVVVAPPA